MKRIICVGNGLRDDDRTGPDAYARLARMAMPPDVEVVDGGLAGLDLLKFMDGTQRVVFIDSVRGFAAPGQVVLLEPSDLDEGNPAGFDHASSFSYVLGVYPAILAPPLPVVNIVGVEEPADQHAVEQAVRLALALVTEVAVAAQTD